MRERRQELGLKQREVAERIPGKTESKDVSRWESGHHLPQSDTLGRIADALETTIADLRAGPLAERPEKGPTPDPLAGGDSAMAETLARINEKLEEVSDQVELLLRKADLDQDPEELLDDQEADAEAELRPSPDSDEQTEQGKRAAEG